MDVHEIMSEVQGSKNLFENVLSFVDELLESYSATMKMFSVSAPIFLFFFCITLKIYPLSAK